MDISYNLKKKPPLMCYSVWGPRATVWPEYALVFKNLRVVQKLPKTSINYNFVSNTTSLTYWYFHFFAINATHTKYFLNDTFILGYVYTALRDLICILCKHSCTRFNLNGAIKIAVKLWQHGLQYRLEMQVRTQGFQAGLQSLCWRLCCHEQPHK